MRQREVLYFLNYLKRFDRTRQIRSMISIILRSAIAQRVAKSRVSRSRSLIRLKYEPNPVQSTGWRRETSISLSCIARRRHRSANCVFRVLPDREKLLPSCWRAQHCRLRQMELLRSNSMRGHRTSNAFSTWVATWIKSTHTRVGCMVLYSRSPPWSCVRFCG